MEYCELTEKSLRTEECSEPDWAGNYDLIVVGLGTAGAQCAYTAVSRYPVKLLGIEELNWLGGTASAGEITEYYCGNKGGLYQKVDHAAAEMEQDSCFVPNAQGISGWAKHLALQEKLAHEQAALLFDSVVTGIWREDGSVIGVSVLDGFGLEHAYRGKYIIDCTGDGHVCAMAGCEMQWSKETLTPFQPFSNIRVVLTERGVRCCNVDSGYADPQGPWEFGRKILESAELPNFYLKDYALGEPLLYNAPILGVREGKRIVGRDTVTFSDILNGVDLETPVFYGYSNIDNHCRATAFESQLYQDWIAAAGMWSVYLKFPVPVGALLPKELNGLLAAGRIISADHDAACALRMKDEMYKSGETAAHLACISLRLGLSADRIPYPVLREELLRTGCLRQGERPDQLWDSGTTPLRKIHWEVQTDELHSQLASSKPGAALWAARRTRDPKLTAALTGWLCSNQKLLRFHSAISLALADCPACAPVLKEMLLDRSGAVLESSKKFCYPYAVLAIYLVGRLRYTELSGEVLDILRDDSRADAADFQANDLCGDREDLRFQYFTHAAAALYRLSEGSPALREEVQCMVKERLKNHRWFLSLGDAKIEVNLELSRWSDRMLQR